METREIIICILLAIVTTNLIRILPMTFIKGRIRNVFLRSFLYYVPYVTLAVMTFPAIINATQSKISGILALVCGSVAAWFNMSLFKVACICCGVVFVTELFL